MNKVALIRRMMRWRIYNTFFVFPFLPDVKCHCMFSLFWKVSNSGHDILFFLIQLISIQIMFWWQMCILYENNMANLRF